MLAHRRVACTASFGGGSAQVEDTTDDIEEDLEGREEVSEIIDSGDETEEVDCASDDRREGMGHTDGALGLRE